MWRGRGRAAAAGSGLLTTVRVPADTLPADDYVVVIATSGREERGRYVLRLRAADCSLFMPCDPGAAPGIFVTDLLVRTLHAGRHGAVLYHGMPRPLPLTVLTAALAVLVGTAPHAAPQAPPRAWAGAPGARVLLDAHNCYPDGGKWTDRIDRALATGLPVAIEQDLVWFRDPRSGVSRSILSHGEPFTGTEPSLATHFFERIRPLVEQALRDGRRETWPLVVLNLDLKTNEPEHHAAIWETLGTYEAWLTTAARVADGTRPAPLDVKPVLVLTGNPDAQQAAFHDRVPVGGRLRLFGAIPVDLEAKVGKGKEAIPKLAGLSPAELIASGATNYRRWVNFPWAVVERGGQAEAGAWTPADAARLAALSALAHSRGLWIRFYTLNGHAAADDRGWTASYNFGSPAAVETRWRAARDAGVDFIATDQYEGLARILARPAAQSAAPPATSPAPAPTQRPGVQGRGVTLLPNGWRIARRAGTCRPATSRCRWSPRPTALPDRHQQRLLEADADRRRHRAVDDQGHGAGRARVARPGLGRRRQAALLVRRGREHRPRVRLRRAAPEAGHAAGRGAAGAAAAARHDRHGRDRLRRRHRHRRRRQDAVRRARLRPGDQRASIWRPARCARPVPLPAEPYTVRARRDGAPLFVSLWGGAKVLVLDAATLAATGEIAVGEHPNAMVLSKDGERLFVACANTNAVWVIDAATRPRASRSACRLFPEAPPGTTPERAGALAGRRHARRRQRRQQHGRHRRRRAAGPQRGRGLHPDRLVPDRGAVRSRRHAGSSC